MSEETENEAQELSLDDVLEGRGELESSTEETAEEAVDGVDDDKGTDTTGETEDPPPGSEDNSNRTVPVAALTDERTKRQALQQDNDSLNQRINNLTAGQPQPTTGQPEEIDFLTDPDAWRDQLLGHVGMAMQNVRQESNMQFIRLVEEKAKEVHGAVDYDEKLAYFTQAVQANPALGVEAGKAADPAEFAYSTGEKLKRLSEGGGDLDALIQREREAAVREHLEQNPSEGDTPLDVPTSLSKVTAGKGSNNRDPGNPSVEQLFD